MGILYMNIYILYTNTEILLNYNMITNLFCIPQKMILKYVLQTGRLTSPNMFSLEVLNF